MPAATGRIFESRWQEIEVRVLAPSPPKATASAVCSGAGSPKMKLPAKPNLLPDALAVDVWRPVSGGGVRARRRTSRALGTTRSVPLGLRVIRAASRTRTVRSCTGSSRFSSCAQHRCIRIEIVNCIRLLPILIFISMSALQAWSRQRCSCPKINCLSAMIADISTLDHEVEEGRRDGCGNDAGWRSAAR